MLQNNTDSLFKAWKTSRAFYLHYVDHYSTEQLNTIPHGFNNNLIWNIGHVVVTQQMLVYKGSNLQGYLPEQWYELFKIGTKPSRALSVQEIRELREWLTVLVEHTEQDLNQGIFKTYIERKTKTGFHLQSIYDALECNNYHEGMHLGIMMSLAKCI